MKILKVVFVFILIVSIGGVANADRGVFGKKKNRVQLNIVTATTLKRSIPFNLKSGLAFKGSTILHKQHIGNSIFNTALISYKKETQYTFCLTDTKCWCQLTPLNQATNWLSEGNKN